MQSVPLILFLFALLGGAVAAIFAPLYLDLFRRELSRADEMEETARTLGLRFSRGDPAYPGSTAFRYPFELFSRGIEQTCENFITGTIDGVDGSASIFCTGCGSAPTISQTRTRDPNPFATAAHWRRSRETARMSSSSPPRPR